MNNFNQLEAALGYAFTNKGLLRQALTHCSAKDTEGCDYERLEYLGDSVVGYTAARMLFDRFPDADVGDLSRRRSTLVRTATLASIGKSIGIPACIIMGHGERGGAFRDALIEDVLESLIGAICLDSDFNTASAVAYKLLDTQWSLMDTPACAQKDPKTVLQEILQRKKAPLPTYKVVKVSGAAHQQEFTVECGCFFGKTTGVGSSRRAAEQGAARALLSQLNR